MTGSTCRRPSPDPTAATIWRRLFHLTAGSIVPVTGIFVPWLAIIVLAGILAAISLSLDLARFRSAALNRVYIGWLKPLLKSGEDHRITGATYMLVAAVIAFLVFDQLVAITALLFLSIGDPLAALVGGRVTALRLFGKSPVGTLALIGASLLVVLVLSGTGAVPYHWGLVLGAVVAGLAELAPIPLDDNLTVPLASGALMQFLVV